MLVGWKNVASGLLGTSSCCTSRLVTGTKTIFAFCDFAEHPCPVSFVCWCNYPCRRVTEDPTFEKVAVPRDGVSALPVVKALTGCTINYQWDKKYLLSVTLMRLGLIQ